MNKLVCVENFGVRGFVAFYAQVRHASLQTGIVTAVLNNARHFEEKYFRIILLYHFYADGGVCKSLISDVERVIKSFRNGNSEADNARRIRENALRIFLRVFTVKNIKCTYTAYGGTCFESRFFYVFACKFHFSSDYVFQSFSVFSFEVLAFSTTSTVVSSSAATM